MPPPPHRMGPEGMGPAGVLDPAHPSAGRLNTWQHIRASSLRRAPRTRLSQADTHPLKADLLDSTWLSQHPNRHTQQRVPTQAFE